MTQKTALYRFNYDEYTQKFVFEDLKVPFSVREFIDNIVFCSLFGLRVFHVLQLNTGLYRFRIVRHKNGNFPFDCYVTSL